MTYEAKMSVGRMATDKQKVPPLPKYVHKLPTFLSEADVFMAAMETSA